MKGGDGRGGGLTLGYMEVQEESSSRHVLCVQVFDLGRGSQLVCTSGKSCGIDSLLLGGLSRFLNEIFPISLPN